MRLVAPALALLLASPAFAAPPPATLSLVETGLKRSEARKIGGPAKVVSRAVVSKPGGGDREEIVEETLLAADGTSESRIVSATKDGKDVTAEKRAEREKKKARTDKTDKADKTAKAAPEGGRASLGFKVPTGEDRPLFAFDEPRIEGELLVAAYRPVRGARGDDLSAGRIAWRQETGEPAWLEATYVSMPTGLKEFLVRFEFAGKGDGTYTRLVRTQGVGGLLWIKRKFDVTVEITVGPGSPQR